MVCAVELNRVLEHHLGRIEEIVGIGGLDLADFCIDWLPRALLILRVLKVSDQDSIEGVFSRLKFTGREVEVFIYVPWELGDPGLYFVPISAVVSAEVQVVEMGAVRFAFAAHYQTLTQQ